MCNGKNKALSPICMALSILAIVATVQAHENHAHKPKEAAKTPVAADELELFQKINAEYVKQVKPIFQKSCFDCHSSNTDYPWYAKLPGAKQLIEKDIRESKEHLDFTNDFPFGGHGVPSEDLIAIRESIDEETMPPWRYWILHRDSRLSDSEKAIVKSWIENSLKLLGEPKASKGHESH